MATGNIYFDMLINFVKQYWWVVLFMIAASFIKLFAPIIKGKVGEGVVNLAAKLRLDPNVYHLIKDVTVPAKTGTTQIDHVIVSKFGVFVIETKNYKGWIFANAKDAKWTQNIYGRKHRFQNPLRQNFAHISALSELLELPKEKIIGVVCFMGDAKFKTPIPEGVFLEGRYVNYIESFQTPVFSETEVADLIQRIESGRLERGFKTNRAHVQQLNARHTPGGRRAVAAGYDRAEPSQEKNDSAVNNSANRKARHKHRQSILGMLKIFRLPLHRPARQLIFPMVEKPRSAPAATGQNGFAQISLRSSCSIDTHLSPLDRAIYSLF